MRQSCPVFFVVVVFFFFFFFFCGVAKFCLAFGMRQLTRDTKSGVSC